MWHNAITDKGYGDVLPGKHELKITVRENVAVKLQVCKGCGSWSDAIDSLFGTIEEQKKYISELKEMISNGQTDNNKNIFK